TEKVCSLKLKGEVDKGNKPIIVDSRVSSPAYPSPKIDDSSIVIPSGSSVRVLCPGKTNQESSQIIEPGVVIVKDKAIKQTHVAEPIECVDDNTFKLQGKPVDFLDIECEQKPRTSYNAILRSADNKKCHNGDRYEVGFGMENKDFLRTIYLCHNKHQAKTLWAHRVISPSNVVTNRYTGESKKVFKKGMLYNDMQISKEDPYSLNVAYNTLSSILGSSKKADKYLSTKTSDKKFLAKGHLIANADMLYKNEQESTYFLANVIPMWQQVNANPGNWFFVEEYVRHLASKKRHPLHVWVGGIGVLELEGKPFYLYRKAKSDGTFDQRLPVPKVLYKCVVDKESKQALCFFVVNNPYASKAEVEALQNNYIVCKKHEECEKISQKYDNPALGYMYCCELGDFYKKNKNEVGLEDVIEYLNYPAIDLIYEEKEERSPKVSVKVKHEHRVPEHLHLGKLGVKMRHVQ
ncbi:hypothetical protein QAD02_009067, partial [Eretmocerus hayati]